MTVTNCDEAELFLNGASLEKTNVPEYEVCVLLKVYPDSDVPSGFAVGITLSLLDA